MLAALACTQLPGWQPEWAEPLTFAALTMNLTSHRRRMRWTRQHDAPSEMQKATLLAHTRPRRGAPGRDRIDDPLWLHAVLHHHDAVAGAMAGRAPEDMIARLIRRADRYAARLSPRKSRPGLVGIRRRAGRAAGRRRPWRRGRPGSDPRAGPVSAGVWVKLQCGEIALVLRRTPLAKSPIVVSLVSRTGLPLAVPALRNTRSPGFAVTCAVPPAQVKVRPNLDALEKMA